MASRRRYARGGGESGTEEESSGSGSNAADRGAAGAGTMAESDGASTAAGPMSEAVIAATGSDVGRHEQECDPGFDLDLTWCIGQIRPSP